MLRLISCSKISQAPADACKLKTSDIRKHSSEFQMRCIFFFNYFPISQQKTYIMSTQMNYLGETVVLNIQNISLD